MNFALPTNVEHLLLQLKRNGYAAYVVGGCVRDMIMGKEPHDYDICTSALPEEVMNIFKGKFQIIPTGLQHGTVTVVVREVPYEITTFRIDGDYEDGRHPSSVEFTTDIVKDLSRRDFTINAMAYAPGSGLIDPFDGLHDIKRERIRAVGDPTARFEEDALRIMRAIRFSATLGFGIEYETMVAMFNCNKLLEKISKERINAELSKILVGDYIFAASKYLPELLFYVIPDLSMIKGFEQFNPYHKYDVWEHTRHVIGATESDKILRLAALFHDIGKPYCVQEESVDGKLRRHFIGHAEVSAGFTKQIMQDLKFSNDEIETVVDIIKNHSEQFLPTKRFVRRMLNKMGREHFEYLLALREADIIGQGVTMPDDDRLSRLGGAWKVYNEFNFEKECFSLKNLNINGNDLLEIGFVPGPAIGKTLNLLLDLVMTEKLPNNKGDLIDFIINNREEILS
jgi:tRNA nucleotidyltransferase (CCA-adding enzyme)